MFARLALASLALAGGFAAPAHSASSDDASAPLWRAAHCMLDVLKTTPGVEAPRLGRADDGQGAPRPTVEYLYSNGKGEKRTLRFGGADLGGAHVFSTALPGVAPEGQAPDDWGTASLGKLWKARCGVVAAVFYD